MKRIVKLINNERVNAVLLSKKASDSTNECAYIDNAICSFGSVDLCNKDYAGCTNYSVDDCTFYFSDYAACHMQNRDTGNG